MSDTWFEHLSATLSENGLIAYMWDVDRDTYQWAGNFQSLFGIASEDKPQSNAQFNRLINPQDVPRRLASVHDVTSREAVGDHYPGFKAAYKIKRANGMQVDVSETASLLIDETTGSRIIRGFIKIMDMAQLETAKPRQQESIAPIQKDTGMTHYGRRALLQKIDEWQESQISRGLGNNSRGYLLVVGIDRVTMFNEAFGPRFTDELIERTGERLRKIVGDQAFVTRVDGDVFAVFFREAPHAEMAAVAKYMLNNFQDVPLQTERGPVGISVSIGGYIPEAVKRQDPAQSLVKAEMAMRSAKEQGRSCFVSYMEAADRAENNRQMLSSGDQFMRALKDNRVKLAFQPVMNSKAENVSFHECLIRLIDEQGKMQSAGQFFPAIEKLGLSRLVDQYAMRMAIHELSLFPDLSLSVNVSHATLVNQDWLRGLVMALRDRPSVASRLVIEVTESAAINNPEHVQRVCRTLQDLGCKVALDDFGAGYTAFSQLKDLNIDIVKIDKQYIRGIGEDQNHAFVKTLQALADSVDIETVGEGAETLSEAKFLAGEGIDHIQGYAYGFPRVERVWLPQHHTYRKILREEGATPRDDAENLRQDILGDITAMAKT